MSWIQELIHYSVSLIKVSKGNKSEYATGFFFDWIPDSDLKKNGWIKVDKRYFVTAKHALYDYNEKTYSYDLCDSVTISFIQFMDENKEKLEITIQKDKLKEIIRVHENDDVDIVVIDLSDYKVKISGHDLPISMLHTRALSRNQLPKYDDFLSVEATSDVIVYGFPYGYYDTKNLFPLAKSGIISSGWGLNFNDDPVFKIDIQLFPISSGSPVILKPTNLAFKDGKMYLNSDKRILFLGIYTGEYEKYISENAKTAIGQEIVIERKISLGFGTVFYSELIEEIVNRN